MSKEQVNRTSWLTIRLTPEEYKSVCKRVQKTTCQSISEYGREILLLEKVTVLNRDQSMDEILEELILLRKELNFIGNNFNQSVRKLNSVSEMPEAQLWQSMLEVLRDQLEPSICQIKERINKYSDLWSLKLSVEKA